MKPMRDEFSSLRQQVLNCLQNRKELIGAKNRREEILLAKLEEMGQTKAELESKVSLLNENLGHNLALLQ